MKLAINLATRGRPQLLVSTVMRTLQCVTRPDTVLMVSADADDAPTIEAIVAVERAAGSVVKFVASIEEREDTIAEKWNRVLTAVPDADVYMTMCDDRPVITPGFDALISEAAGLFPDGIGVVTNYLENLTFPGIQAVTGRWVELVGYIFPPIFPYWFVDHWLLDLTRMTGRDVFAAVRLDASVTPPTQERRELAFWATVYDAFYLQRRKQAARILEQFIREPGWCWWQSEMLRSRWPVYEQHSKMINDQCRGARDPGPPPDERYLRIKRKVQALLREELAAIAADQPEAA